MYSPFSVSVCVYAGDNSDYFKVAIESILKQTIPPSEIVLVVDGPIPQSLDAVVSFYEKNPIFKVIKLEENQGHGEARRIGLENCSYDFVALMDADDISVPDRFEKQLEFLKNDETLSIVGGNIAEFIDNVDNIVGYRTVLSEDEAIKEDLKKRCPMNQVTVMFRKKDIAAVGGYIDWYSEEDYYLWIRMYLAGMRFANLSDVLVNVRIGNEMYRRRGGLRYFKSEAKLQKYMWKNQVISFSNFIVNISKRLVVQVLLPNWLRGLVFKKFARKQKNA